MTEVLTTITPALRTILIETTDLVDETGLHDRFDDAVKRDYARFLPNPDELEEIIEGDAPYVFYGRETVPDSRRQVGQLVVSLAKATLGGRNYMHTFPKLAVPIGAIQVAENATGDGDRLCKYFTDQDISLGISRIRAQFQGGLYSSLETKTGSGLRVVSRWPNRDRL